MFPYLALLGSTALNTFGTQLALYVGLGGQAAGATYLNREYKRQDKLKISPFWDRYRAVEQMKIHTGKTVLSKSEEKEAKKLFSEEWELYTVTQDDITIDGVIPDELLKYRGEYLLSKSEAPNLFFCMDQEAIRLGIDNRGEFIMRLVEGTGFSAGDVLDAVVPDGWDSRLVLAELKEVSRLRLEDKRIVKRLRKSKTA